MGGRSRKLDGRSEESRTEKKVIIEIQMGMIKQNRDREKNLREDMVKIFEQQ